MKTFSPQLLIPLSIPIVWAFYQYLTKIISVNREPFVAVFYSGIVGTVIFSLYTFVNWIPFNSYMVWLQLIVLGTFGFISHIVLVYAIQLSNLSFVANFQYSQLVWSSIVSFLIFGVPIEINRLFGMVAIIIFGVLFIKFELSKKIN
jgi:drug/metabolite transporter (DMT)-like permease